MDEDAFINKLTGIARVNPNKAKALYDAGYTDISHFRDATIEDLLLVPSINPTVARKIITRTQMIAEIPAEVTDIEDEDTIIIDTEKYEKKEKFEDDFPISFEEKSDNFRKIDKEQILVWTVRIGLMGTFWVWIIIGLIAIMLAFIDGNPYGLFITIGFNIFVLFLAFIYAGLFNASYAYALEEKNVQIKRGVFFRKKAIIPYDRIQNVNILNGPVERIFGLSTVEIETAGRTMVPYGGMGPIMSLAEGVIPGTRDPEQLMNDILRRKANVDRSV
jgi:membrane protein YdbS with pleckstrin-like domain